MVSGASTAADARRLRPPARLDPAAVRGIAIFVILVAAGLYYVKWNPSYHRAFTAASRHSIGASIVSGEAAAPPAVGWPAAWSYTIAYFKAVWQAVILGLLIGAGVQVLVPCTWMSRRFGHSGFASTAVAGLAAVPSMMCTCCAAPAAVGLARSGASVGAILAYWLGNPMLNPATMIFTGFVLGWNWVVLRIVVGTALVLGVAQWANGLVTENSRAAHPGPSPTAPPVAPDRPSFARWAGAVWELSRCLIPEYVVIVMALGAARAWLFPAMNPAIGHSLWLMGVFAIGGTLFVVPTAAEIPIVQALMALGLGSGGAAALLTTLPAAGLPALLMLRRGVPARALVAVSLAVVALGVISGGAAEALGF